MAVANRFASFLDRFDAQLVANGDRMKHELNQFIDERVALMRTKVQMIRFDVIRARKEKVVFDDEPKVVTVSLDEWMQQERGRAAEESHKAPSTSSAGHKRKSSSSNKPRSTNKRHKTTTAGSNRFVCKYPECGQTFPFDSFLARHERIHLGVKPFICTWPDCRYSSETRGNAIQHVRLQHFKLPKTKQQQKRGNIVDDRNPQNFVREDQDMMKRRLE